MEEFDSGAVPMANVSTSTAGFVGAAKMGPAGGAPVLITRFSDFYRIFGGYLSEAEFGEYRYLAYSVNLFFANGGSRCYVKRVVPSDAAYAHGGEDAGVRLYARNPGVWGNKVTVRIKPSFQAKTQLMEMLPAGKGFKFQAKNAGGFAAGDIVAFQDGEKTVLNRVAEVDGSVLSFEEAFGEEAADAALIPTKTVSVCTVDVEVGYDSESELYEGCSLNQSSPDFINQRMARSALVLVQFSAPEGIMAPFAAISGKEDGELVIGLSGGSDGTKAALSAADFIGTDKGPGERTGIQAFLDNNEVSVMAVPGVTDPQVELTLIAHCENLGSRFAILDIPKESKGVSEVLEFRNMFDSGYAAMYHPWLKTADPLTRNSAEVPPSGAVAGIFARTDNTRGVHKAPANEIVSACTGLSCSYNTGEQDILNPRGVNLIRSFPGQGIRVWGARTLSSNALWRYVNVRRLFIYVEESIKASTGWVVFEPNDQVLWLRVRRTIEIFLTDVWRSGALAGASESDAFFVNIGPETMTQGDIDAGRLICVIGIAPVKPAEFVIFRITQKTAEA